jgi:Do/DeqQ family serine protease
VVNISSQYEIRKNSNPFSGYGMDPMLDKFFREFFSPELQRREQRTSLGSGVIIDGRLGFVLTNTHVVEKATMISVLLNDEREFEADLVGMDPDSDLAVLKIKSGETLPSIQMGNSDDIMIGESVIAIGNPFGFSHTVTTGVVSAAKRSIKTAERVFHEFIQTDASINPGNSGGPLLNIDGELIGINTAIHAQAQGIGFAIPINRARRIISDLINYGKVVDAWIGLTIHPIDTNLADYLKLPTDSGVIVSEVESHSPAATAGFKEGDIVLAVDGLRITDTVSYQSKMNIITANQTLAFEISRDGKVHRVSLTTSIFPLDQALVLANQRLGITVSGLDPDTRATYGLRSRLGVVIIEMRRGSDLSRIGVRPGDLIRQIGDTRVNTMSDFKTAIVKHRNKQSVVILIERDGALYHINATMKAT